MAYRSNQTVHICAPSNAAIDEILTRINAKGLLCLSHFRGPIKKENNYAPTSFFNTDAPAFTDGTNFEPENAVQYKDIILRLGAEEYEAPAHLRQYSFSERAQVILRADRLQTAKKWLKLSKSLLKDGEIFDVIGHFDLRTIKKQKSSINLGFPYNHIKQLEA